MSHRGTWSAARAIALGRTVLAPAVGHPQFALHAFLARMEMRREEVHALAARAAHGRERLLSEALRPAAATDRWSERLRGDGFGTAVDGLALIEAAQPAEEALAIAVALREAVENPEAVAALVTPDRGLARRVVAALGRWNVAVDDSGGEPLADTPAGVFARLAAEAALGGLEPVALLALLKHPLLRLGLSDARPAARDRGAGARRAARAAAAPWNGRPCSGADDFRNRAGTHCTAAIRGGGWRIGTSTKPPTSSRAWRAAWRRSRPSRTATARSPT